LKAGRPRRCREKIEPARGRIKGNEAKIELPEKMKSTMWNGRIGPCSCGASKLATLQPGNSVVTLNGTQLQQFVFPQGYIKTEQ
jgi:hypothetical protein